MKNKPSKEGEVIKKRGGIQMNKGNNFIEEYKIVTDDWQVKGFEDEKEAIAALKSNKGFLFIYRTFFEVDEHNFKTTTGSIEYFQDSGIKWSQILSFNGWRINNLDTRGIPFNIKDPIGEIIEHGSDQEELEKTYDMKWPEGLSYVGFIAKILYMLSKYKNWDDYKTR